MESSGSNGKNFAERLPTTRRRERAAVAAPMTRKDTLRQYRIGKPSESSLWYRCPKTWTPEMVKFYTKIDKSKRTFDCRKVLNEQRGKYH